MFLKKIQFLAFGCLAFTLCMNQVHATEVTLHGWTRDVDPLAVPYLVVFAKAKVEKVEDETYASQDLSIKDNALQFLRNKYEKELSQCKTVTDVDRDKFPDKNDEWLLKKKKQDLVLIDFRKNHKNEYEWMAFLENSVKEKVVINKDFVQNYLNSMLYDRVQKSLHDKKLLLKVLKEVLSRTDKFEGKVIKADVNIQDLINPLYRVLSFHEEEDRSFCVQLRKPDEILEEYKTTREVVKILLDHGANPKIKLYVNDKEFRTPIGYLEKIKWTSAHPDCRDIAEIELNGYLQTANVLKRENINREALQDIVNDVSEMMSQAAERFSDS